MSKLFHEEDYGFLATSDESEVYFHKNSVLNDAFNRLTIGARVTFNEQLGEKGVQASTVRQLDKRILIARSRRANSQLECKGGPK